MGLHNPLPKSLKAECDKCAKILHEFTMPSKTAGPDRIIPEKILLSAKGLAIITVVKVGFLVSLRGGSGLVVARLPNGEWSAPAAVGLGGLGGGLEIGGEITDFVIVLNSDRAVSSFKKGGNVTLGGNLTCAAGPYGRNFEGDIAVRNAAAFFTYSRSRGLFAGLSLEGTAIVERKGANQKLYGANVRARDLLQGNCDPPAEAANLYRALNQHCGGSTTAALHRANSIFSGARSGAGAAPSVSRPTGSPQKKSGSSFKMPSLPSFGGSKSKSSTPASRTSSQRSTSSTSGGGGGGGQGYSASYRSAPMPSSAVLSAPSYYGSKPKPQPKPQPRSGAGGGGGGASGSSSASTRLRLKSINAPKTTFRSQFQADEPEEVDEWDKDLTCKALYSYKKQMDCDLEFATGDTIVVLTRTDSQNDWWEGRIGNRVGIFPANYVKLEE